MGRRVLKQADSGLKEQERRSTVWSRVKEALGVAAVMGLASCASGPQMRTTMQASVPGQGSEFAKLLKSDLGVYPSSEARFSYIEMARRTVPNPALRDMSQVRSTRLAAELEYLPFLARIQPSIRGMSDEQVANLTLPQLDEQRFKLARSWLEQAVKAAAKSGMNEDNELMAAAKAWHNETQAAPDASKMVATADILQGVATALLSIREAEIWLSNGDSWLGSQKQPCGLECGKEYLRLARQSYSMSFSDPQAAPSYLLTGPRELAAKAIECLAPRSFRNTEAVGVYFTRSGYLNPETEGFNLYGKEPTMEVQLRSAAAAEQKYLTIVFLAGSGDYGKK